VNALIARIKALRFSERTLPLALLALCLLAFGLFIPKLGLYWDDWPVIVMAKMGSARNFWDFYVYDRPFSAWTYVLTVPIFGTRPITWHIFTLGLRWLACLLAWRLIAGIWPAHRSEAAWTALLFAVYPVFTQQSIAVAYSQHWICAVLYLGSMVAMVRAWRNPAQSWLWTGLGLLSAALGMFTMEYFFGLELIRPLALWFMATQDSEDTRARRRRVLAYWLPYLLLFVATVLWRLFLLKLPGEDPNRPELLIALLREPAAGLLGLLQAVVQDTVQIMFASWYPALQPAEILLASRSLLFAWGIAILAAALTAYYLPRLSAGQATEGSEAGPRQMLAFGIVWILLGPLPVWLTGKQLIVGYYSDRFGLPGMLGASLVLVGLLVWLTPRRNVQIALLSALIALAVARQIGISNDYRRAWEKQLGFYWELYWRAPSVEPHTAFISDGEIFPYVGTYSTTSGLNLLYRREGDPADFAYWFYSMGRKLGNQLDRFLAGKPLHSQFRTWEFIGEARDSLSIFYDGQRCLRVLAEGMPENATLPELILPAVPFSNLDRISAQPPTAGPPEDIFGREPAHTWCYYYEKADLARQLGDWAAVNDLGTAAQSAGLAPYDPIEWFVFIEGYARGGRAAEAAQLSESVHASRPDYDPLLCELWDARIMPGASGAEPARIRANMDAWLICPPP
jgi:hypothetical protein